MKETPNKRLLHLQNGSDIRGVALATEGGPAVRLTPEAANTIAAAFGIWLEKRTGKPADALCVGVGHDSRLTAQTLKQAIIEGLSARGVHMVDCGLASSPAMFMGTIFKETKFDGSIMITASHLPKNRNGMKFFVAEGGLDAEDITEILQTAATLTPAAGTAPAEAS
ncbi:phosphomannomutase/phosphoglucomutase, partial [Ruminococcaceae bacterium OttesenSCG-928-O06]|nr:phosphomannomutase/phosphoglucomutase [Ruminococcaceae bacterium OttesenSCG-928-O06]